MKINKIILRILHLFGVAKTQAHIDDVKIYIPSDYGHNGYNFEFTTKIVDDIKEQAYRELEKNTKLKKWCTRTKQIWVVLPGGLMKVFNYIDGTLYWPGLDDVAAERANKLSKILDEE
jgi:hypothetical protein